ncbi:hypothetical protein [Peribacillus simplex]|uniref:hypothetical protein n=1 Tax=Peribacillus simplex TaxID=1478 RepID=UPI00296F36B9|nr:hypothetical protein [Peribacillus simplex]
MKFETCRLNEVNFSRTPLKGIDISSSTFQRITVSPEDLKGCEVSPDQAIVFAAMLGLKIKE